MLTDALAGALSTLGAALAAQPELEAALVASWLPRTAARGKAPELEGEIGDAVRRVAEELPVVTQSEAGLAALSPLFADDRALPLLAWCAASTFRREVRLATLLGAAAKHAGLAERVVAVARDRVVAGPLLDALACAPLMAAGHELALPENAQARARLEILIWEAGASALEVPLLGPWLWGSRETFDALIKEPAHG